MDLRTDGSNGVLCDAAAVLLMRLRAQYGYDDRKSPCESIKYRSYTFPTPTPDGTGTKFGSRATRRGQRDPRKVASIFHDMVYVRGWQSPLAVSAVTARWAEFVGENNASHSYVENFAGTKVVIRCDSTVWANSLKMMKKTIVEIFDREVGEQVVTEVEILGPKGIPNWNKGPRSVSGRGPRDTYG